jgi:hypothetical protein
MDIRFEGETALSPQDQSALTAWATLHASDSDIYFVVIGRDAIAVRGSIDKGQASAIASTKRRAGNIAAELDTALASMRASGPVRAPTKAERRNMPDAEMGP